MVQDRRKRVEKILDKGLTREQRQLFQLVSIENYKDKVVFRMPAGFVSLETVWVRVVELMTENGIEFSRFDPFATVEDLDAILSNISWLWPGWLPEGFNTMLAGDPGVGKSAIALEWVGRVTRGEPWPLTTEKAKPANAIWIETEASQQLVNIRSKTLNVDRRRLYIPIIDGDMLGQPDIWNESHRQQILNLIEAKEPKLVVLDSLGSATSRGENRKEDVAPVLEFFAMTARDYGTAALIVHHLRKMSINEPAEVSLSRVRGSSAITALSRTVVALDRPQTDKARLAVIKSNLARPDPPLGVTFDEDKDGHLAGITYERYVPPAGKKLKKEIVADWVIATIAECGGSIGLKELVERAEPQGYTRGNLYSAKEVLEDRVAVSGTGNHAQWALANDRESEAIITKAHAKRKTK